MLSRNPGIVQFILILSLSPLEVSLKNVKYCYKIRALHMFMEVILDINSKIEMYKAVFFSEMFPKTWNNVFQPWISFWHRAYFKSDSEIFVISNKKYYPHQTNWLKPSKIKFCSDNVWQFFVSHLKKSNTKHTNSKNSIQQ